MSSVASLKGITRAKIHRYIILKILDWGGELKFKDLEEWSNLEPKYIINALRSLLSWSCIKKGKDENGYVTYRINSTGKRVLRVYEERGLKNYWKPPWESQK